MRGRLDQGEGTDSAHMSCVIRNNNIEEREESANITYNV